MKNTIENIRAAMSNGARLSEIPLVCTYYARVSTDRDEQLGSLTNQRMYFERKIKENPNWTYVDGYIDEGLSGTSTDKRIQFLKMIADAKSGKFDLILTKEVSRFARDLLDSIRFTRELLKYDVGVFFEDLSINTMEPDTELRLAIMASVAQEESRKLSERVKFGYRRTQEVGKRHGATAPIGYKFNNENNGYHIDENLAPMVKYVFERYAENRVGFRQIASEIAEKGYRNLNGNKYYPSTIRRMLENPVYKGYIVNGKSFSKNYRAREYKKAAKDQWMLHYDPIRVPPIVSDELWAKVNEVLKARGEFIRDVDCSARNKNGSGKYPYSSRLQCHEHGCNYQRSEQHWVVKGEKRSAEYWRCANYKHLGAKNCSSPLLYTKDLNNIMRDLFGQLSQANSDEEILLKIVEQATEISSSKEQQEEVQKQIDLLKKKKARLLTGWIDGVVSDDDYKASVRNITDQIDHLSDKLSDFENISKSANAISGKLYEMLAVINQHPEKSDEIIDELVRRFVKRIVVRKQDEGQEGSYVLDVFLYLPSEKTCSSYALCDRTQNWPQAFAT